VGGRHLAGAVLGNVYGEAVDIMNIFIPVWLVEVGKLVAAFILGCVVWGAWTNWKRSTFGG